MTEEDLADLDEDRAQLHTLVAEGRGTTQEGYMLAFSLARRVEPLMVEVRRLRTVMHAVYEAGCATPGNRTAAVVEPLWKALHREVTAQSPPESAAPRRAAPPRN